MISTDQTVENAWLNGVDASLGLLALAAGSMDVLGFFALGGALPSAMTGNTALLGLALGQMNFTAALPPFAAATGFVLGSLLAAMLVHLFGDQPPRRTVHRLLALEALLLTCFLLAWRFIDHTAADSPRYILIILGGAAMGIQFVAASQDARPGITTIVFTSTLASIVTTLANFALVSPHRFHFAAKRQIFVFLAYGIGAVCGGLLTLKGGHAIPWLALAAVVAALYMHRRAA